MFSQIWIWTLNLNVFYLNDLKESRNHIKLDFIRSSAINLRVFFFFFGSDLKLNFGPKSKLNIKLRNPIKKKRKRKKEKKFGRNLSENAAKQHASHYPCYLIYCVCKNNTLFIVLAVFFFVVAPSLFVVLKTL